MFSVMESNAQSVERSRQNAGQGPLTPKSTASQNMQDSKDVQVAPNTSPSIVPAATTQTVKTAPVVSYDAAGSLTPQNSSPQTSAATSSRVANVSNDSNQMADQLKNEYMQLANSNPTDLATKMKMEVIKQALTNVKNSNR